jgi:PAS domain S-box-containing protein
VCSSDLELRGQYDEMSTLQQRTAESQQMLEQVLNTVPARVFWKDRDLRYLGCNEPFARDAGYSRSADLTGKTDFEMGWRDQAELYRADDRTVIESGIPRIGYEEPQTTPDGSRIWLRTSKIPLRDPDGSIAGVLGTYEDITTTREAEEKIRESEVKFRTIFNNATDAIYIHEVLPDNRPGKFLEVNDTLCSRLGYSREELLTMSVNEIVSEAHLQKMAGIGQQIAKAGFYTFYAEHRRKDGSVFPVEITSHRFTFSGKEIIMAAARDITERKRAEEALRDSEEKYRSVIENIQDIFYRSDLDGNLVMASPSLLKILGYDSLDEVLNRPIAATFYYQPEKRDELLRILAGKGYIEDYEVQLKRKDGTPVWVSTHSHYYQGPDGSRAGVEGVFRDISRRKQVEDGLHAANEQITAQSEELASQLEEMEKVNRALARSEENFQSLVENAPDAIYISVGQRFVYVNAAFVRMMGADSRDQLLGMSLYERIHPDYREAARGRADLITVQRKAGALQDMVYLRMDGTLVDVESSVAPFRFHGDVAGLIILRDISDRKNTGERRRP